MYCTNCGAFNENGATVCVNCYEALDEVQQEEKPLGMKVFNDVSWPKQVDFLKALFDFSFKQFISPKMTKFLFGISILSSGLTAFLLVWIGFNASILFGIAALLIGAPLIFLLSVIYGRVILEMILVIFRIADHTANIVKKSESRDDIQWRI